MFDIIAMTIGLFIGVIMISPIERARLKNFLNMGKSNNGILNIKRKGKGIVNRSVDFNKQELKTPEGTFINNPDRTYSERGITTSYANDESMELIDLNAEIKPEVYDIKCPECGKVHEVTIESVRPIKNPKKITDIVLRAISWGMTAIQDKRTQMLLIAIAIGVIVTIISAVLTYQNGQGISTINGRLDSMMTAISAMKNATVTK
jgi:hypothetical protein